MKLLELYYLKDILSTNLITKFLGADKERIKKIIYMLANSKATKVMSQEKLEFLCECIAFGKYGIIFSESICDISNVSILESLINDYITSGYDDEETYMEIMTKISKIVPNLKMFFVQNEITIANKKEITVLDFLNNGGDLEEALTCLPYNADEIENNTLLNYEKATHILSLKNNRRKSL